jgi:hypothetical protein
MSTTSNPAQTFMVVATVRDNTDFSQFAARRADEQKQLEALRSDGRFGAHYIAPARYHLYRSHSRRREPS